MHAVIAEGKYRQQQKLIPLETEQAIGEVQQYLLFLNLNDWAHLRREGFDVIDALMHVA